MTNSDHLMQALCRGVDLALNSDPSEDKTGFVLLTFDFDRETTWVNYIGNASRKSMATALELMAARLRDAAQLEKTENANNARS